MKPAKIFRFGRIDRVDGLYVAVEFLLDIRL